VPPTPGAPAILTPVPGKASGIRILTEGVYLTTADGGVNPEESFDYVVLAVGLRPVFSPLYGTRKAGILQGLSQATIDSLTDKAVRRVDGVALSGSSPFASVQGKQLSVGGTNHNVFFVGPVGGNFIDDAQKARARGLSTQTLDVFSISENFVSIFALGPITEATARRVARAFEEVPPPVPTALPGAVLRWGTGGDVVGGVVGWPVVARGEMAKLDVALANLGRQGLLVQFRLFLKLRGAPVPPGAAGRVTVRLGLSLAAEGVELRVLRGDEGPSAPRLDEASATRLCSLVEEDPILVMLLFALLTPSPAAMERGLRKRMVIAISVEAGPSGALEVVSGGRVETSLELQ
jgi:hypothetical protein